MFARVSTVIGICLPSLLFLRFVGDVSGLQVVDFGCGEGTNTRRFARAGARMTGIDLSERLIAHARESEEERTARYRVPRRILLRAHGFAGCFVLTLWCPRLH